MGLPDDEGGSQRNPTSRLYCVMCLKDGLPEPLAWITDLEEVFATEDGEPVCSTCGLLHNLIAFPSPSTRHRGA